MELAIDGNVRADIMELISDSGGKLGEGVEYEITFDDGKGERVEGKTVIDVKGGMGAVELPALNEGRGGGISGYVRIKEPTNEEGKKAMERQRKKKKREESKGKKRSGLGRYLPFLRRKNNEGPM